MEDITNENGKKVYPLRNGGHTGRGGKRPGAGRKPDYLKRLGIKAITAAEILAHFDEPDLWRGLLLNKSADIRLRTLAYLTDRRDGKAKQAVDVSGGIVHAHTVYRDPKLATLSNEELQVLDNLTKKLALPAPDGPHNQKESDAAANAIDVECEAVDNIQVPENASNSEIPDSAIDA